MHVTDKAALAGLSEQQIAAAAEAAKDRKLAGYAGDAPKHDATTAASNR